ncbi:MAG: carboxypeptidase-like regulatory domain-containing protein, partial [Pedobacter sp.]|nr:carboxypeptidase-like regulatory domain-containing protein [Pedobacter sp.]
MSLCLAVNVQAQTKITGKVIAGDDKTPIIGASVKVKNAPGGTITDANGIFALNVSPNTVLVISFVGYSSKEVSVGTQTTLNVTLDPVKNDLTEVVVTGYTSQRKKDLTGAVTVVNVAQLKSQPAASAVEA